MLKCHQNISTATSHERPSLFASQQGTTWQLLCQGDWAILSPTPICGALSVFKPLGATGTLIRMWPRSGARDAAASRLKHMQRKHPKDPKLYHGHAMQWKAMCILCAFCTELLSTACQCVTHTCQDINLPAITSHIYDTTHACWQQSVWMCVCMAFHWHYHISISFHIFPCVQLQQSPKDVSLRCQPIVSHCTYGGWKKYKKSCTILDGWNPVKNGINHLSTGAGFLHISSINSASPI